MKLLAPLTALYLLASASAATVRGLIPASTVLPNPSELPADTTITLTTAGELHKTFLRWDNTFVFRNVSEGSYVLDVAAEGYAFSPLRVDVGKGEEVAVKQTWRGRAWSNTGESKGVPIELRPIQATSYYQVREGFNLLKMLSSPMILIAIVSLVSIVFLPKLLDKMDPEFRAEFEAHQKKNSVTTDRMTNNIANFDAASFLAGMGKSSTPAPAQASGSSAGQGGNKRK
ncbi:Similar to UPF0480 protein At4g32130; acc. no. Q8VY97 [Pyronema omphalodes CBS 100304]|uniref:Similar to UPF0480 protein At4g32130 acc. no. Q8VY97 n=1 Tax=Pyronema omphalodes (strain CBS 100304) TaxID=1076935 RepID=U4KU74_PYROM|nr:Similar to UPF0480 protein At4g32130; acc. no. Q8VY97 [Pyronema omphalodes CBS 100304]